MTSIAIWLITLTSPDVPVLAAAETASKREISRDNRKGRHG
jgi:hypothetical protein